jgi:dienelactone hydrolase
MSGFMQPPKHGIVPLPRVENDATPERYNKAAAQQAWTRTIEWFNQYVRDGLG